MSDKFPGDQRKTFYRFFSLSGGLATLESHKLRFSKADSFNDPYELRAESFFPEFDCMNMLKDELFNEVKKISVEPLKTLLGLAAAQGVLDKGEIALRQAMQESVDRYTAGVRSLFDYYRETSYINCLTEEINNVKMWADYADKGRGVVLEFNVSKERDNIFRCAKPIEYIEDIPKLYSSLSEMFYKASVVSRPENWKPLFEHFSYVKNNQWSNEREWRIIIPDVIEKEYLDIELMKGDIKSVYIGYNCSSESDIKKYIQNLEYSVGLEKAEISSSTHGISFTKID